MKIKFLCITFLLLFARGCDIYSTSLWFFENPTDEMNPLVSILGFGWTELIIVNLMIVGLIIYSFYYFTYKYSISKLSDKPEKLTDFVSELYFNKKGKFHQVFYKIPKNKNVLIGHTGYVLTRVAIIGSFLAAFHNLCLFYNVSIYETYSRMVKYPEYVVYVLMLVSIVYYSLKLWKYEYGLIRKNFHSNKE